MINLKEFKQAVLQKAMQGELTKQLPSDGNAKDLINSIKILKRKLVKNKLIRNHKISPINRTQIPFRIPDNWMWVKIPMISTFPDQDTINPSEISNTTWVLDLKDIGQDNGKILRHVTNNIKQVKSSKKLFKEGNVLYGKMNPDLNKVIVADKNGVASTEVFVINLLGNINSYYVSMVMKSAYFSNAVKANIKGVMRRSRTTDFKNYIIPLPPLAEQQRIVSKIHKCFLLADTIQKERDLHHKFAHDMKQSLLLEAMTGHLTQQLPSDGNADDLLQSIQKKKQQLIQAGKIRKHKELPPISKNEIPFKIPKNWKWVRLQNICDYVQKGKSPKYCKSGFPILNQRCIQWSGIDFENHKNISLQTFKKFTPIRHLRSGDVLWNTTGTGTLGRLSLVQKALFNNYKQIVVNGDVMIVRSNKYINSEYLINYLSSFIIQKHLKDLITGSTNQIHLNLSVVLPLMIPLPPLAEQNRVVNKLHDLFDTINA